MKKILDFHNRSFSDVRGINQNIEKPLKHQRRLGLSNNQPNLFKKAENSSVSLFMPQQISLQVPYWYIWDIAMFSLNIAILIIAYYRKKIIEHLGTFTADCLSIYYLSTNTATPPRGDYVQVSGVLQTGRQCSES